MFNDKEINLLSRQAEELKEIYNGIKIHEPLTLLGSFKMDIYGDGIWSRVKIKKKGNEFITKGRATYDLDCDFNCETEVGRCSCMDGIRTYSKDGKNYLKGEKDVWVDWTEISNVMPILSFYAEEITKPISD